MSGPAIAYAGALAVFAVCRSAFSAGLDRRRRGGGELVCPRC